MSQTTTTSSANDCLAILPSNGRSDPSESNSTNETPTTNVAIAPVPMHGSHPHPQPQPMQQSLVPVVHNFQGGLPVPVKQSQHPQNANPNAFAAAVAAISTAAAIAAQAAAPSTQNGMMVYPVPSPHFVAPSVPPQAATGPALFKNMKLRRGKWTPEEEDYANVLIQEFEKGRIPGCENGCTLRAFLSRKLHCAPMRISKKYAGKSIGKHVFLARMHGNGVPTSRPTVADQESMARLEDLEMKFYKSLAPENPSIDGTHAFFPPGVAPPMWPFHPGMNPGAPTAIPFGAIARPHPFQVREFPGAPVLPATTNWTPPAPTVPAQPVTAQPATAQPATAVPAPEPAASPPVAAPASTNSMALPHSHENEHTKQLRETFMNAIKEGCPAEGVRENTTAQDEEQNKMACSPGASSSLKPVESNDNKSVQSTSLQSNPTTSFVAPSTNVVDISQSGNQPSAHNSSSLLSVFDKGAVSQKNEGQQEAVVDSSKPPVHPLLASYGDPYSPSFTSKSFDDFHQFLGESEPLIAPATEPKTSQSKPTNQNNDPAAQKPKSASTGQLRPAEVAGMPQPPLGQIQNESFRGSVKKPVRHFIHVGTSVTADAYALFAQESAMAVSQHSAYCRPDQQEAYHASNQMSAETSSLGVRVKNMTSQSHHLPQQQRKSSVVSVGPGDASSVSQSRRANEITNSSAQVVNAANLKVHDAQSPALPSSSSGAVGPPATKRARTIQFLTNHPNIVSGSERSSDVGTESESILGTSSNTSSTVGSGTDSNNGSDNGSDNASDTGSDEGPICQEKKQSTISGNRMEVIAVGGGESTQSKGYNADWTL